MFDCLHAPTEGLLCARLSGEKMQCRYPAWVLSPRGWIYLMDCLRFGFKTDCCRFLSSPPVHGMRDAFDRIPRSSLPTSVLLGSAMALRVRCAFNRAVGP